MLHHGVVLANDVKIPRDKSNMTNIHDVPFYLGRYPCSIMASLSLGLPAPHAVSLPDLDVFKLSEIDLEPVFRLAITCMKMI